MGPKWWSVILASSLPFMFNVYGQFVFDDSEAIVHNKDVVSDTWVNAFYHDFWGTNITSNSSHKSYRPLTVLSFRANYILNDNTLEAMPFKATNVILHCINCLVLCRVLEVIEKDLGMRRKKKWQNNISLLATLLFAVHPIHVESVSGIVGRADVLASITFLASFYTYRKAMYAKSFSPFFLITAIMCAALSMLFKENGITVMGFNVCYDIFIYIKINSDKQNINNKEKIKPTKGAKGKQGPSFNRTKRVVSTVAAATALLYVRWQVMGKSGPVFQKVDNPAAFSDSFFTKVATFNYVYFLNILLLVWPQWLCYDWSMGCIPLVSSIQDYRLIPILLMYLFAFFVLYAVMKKKQTQLKRLIVISLLLAVIPFLPASNILYPVGFVVAERILYIPSIGFCLFVAIGCHKLAKLERGKKNKISVYLFYGLLVVFGIRSWQRSLEWQNEYRLFTSAVAVCPLNAKVRYNVAKVADAHSQIELAMREYKIAMRLHPGYYQAMNNYGNLLRSLNRHNEAERYLRSAIGVKKDFPSAWMNLGILLAHTKRYEESEKAYREALEYRPYYSDCHYNLGNLYNTMGDKDRAFDSWLQSVSMRPTNAMAWTNLLNLLDQTGQLSKATHYIAFVLKYLPDSPAILFAIANIYGKLEQYEQAESFYKQVIELEGSNARAIHYGNLGVLYQRWKKYNEALVMYRKAMTLDPDYESVKDNILHIHKILRVPVAVQYAGGKKIDVLTVPSSH